MRYFRYREKDVSDFIQGKGENLFAFSFLMWSPMPIKSSITGIATEEGYSNGQGSTKPLSGKGKRIGFSAEKTKNSFVLARYFSQMF